MIRFLAGESKITKFVTVDRTVAVNGGYEVLTPLDITHNFGETPKIVTVLSNSNASFTGSWSLLDDLRWIADGYAVWPFGWLVAGGNNQTITLGFYWMGAVTLYLRINLFA